MGAWEEVTEAREARDAAVRARNALRFAAGPVPGAAYGAGDLIQAYDLETGAPYLFPATDGGAAPTVVSNWHWDYWNVGDESENLEMAKGTFEGFISLKTSFTDAKWDNPGDKGTKYQNPDYEFNPVSYGEEYALIPAGHLIIASFSWWASALFGAHATQDISAYNSGTSIEVYPEPWEGDYSGFNSPGARHDVSNPPSAPWTWAPSDLPINGYSDGGAVTQQLVTFRDSAVGPSSAILISAPTSLADATFHTMAMSWVLVDYGPV